ncbi:iron ABC transporter substrate-binding protein [Hoyosella altamirensis]|uniref:Iron(III) transport system substrate-binding protein n=1 Tax=Hoyosella altamirensis TaxID=616997 RepID=A0A839RG58_9ACTN|nr:iron ABC transporter substrate-binding protein [Hoyosella altamirensis]MBB3035585.1 iron(III) transport system substrate-binding protein [Hoyosella altamirensis]
MITRKRFTTVLAAVALAVPLAACGSDEPTTAAPEGETNGAAEETTLVLYSGRNEDLVAPLIEDLEAATGVSIDVRYGNTAELAAQILEEGANSPADVYFSQDAGALGALSQADLLATLDDETLELVPEQYRAGDDTWVATSGRARVIAYDSEALDEAAVPDTIDALVEPEWRGKVGFAPTNASWQSFVTALRVSRGDDGAREWLEAFRDNEPVSYENNNAILTAVNEGQVEIGLINHYYWYKLAKEEGAESLRANVKYLAPGDEGALINIAGVGVLASSQNQEAAQALVAAMLAEDAQQYFLDETSEYPVIDGLSFTDEGRPQLDELQGPDIDLSDLASLEETQELLTEVGLL